MDSYNASIAKALLELRAATLECNRISGGNFESNFNSMIRKYDIAFMGKSANVVDTVQLRHSLNNYFGVQISTEDLLEIIPAVCKNLGMQAEPMQALDNMGTLAAYMITLWQ